MAYQLTEADKRWNRFVSLACGEWESSALNPVQRQEGRILWNGQPVTQGELAARACFVGERPEEYRLKCLYPTVHGRMERALKKSGLPYTVAEMGRSKQNKANRIRDKLRPDAVFHNPQTSLQKFDNIRLLS